MIVVASGEHVNIAERAIRVIKERARSIMHDLPWKLPICLTKWIMYYTCMRINSLPRIGSGNMVSARELFRGIKLDYIKDTCICFGDYCQAYREVKSNSLEPRCVGAIALCPKDNFSRSWIFLDVSTGKTFSSIKWELLPASDIVIDRMNNLDEYLASERSRKPEQPPPLIDVSHWYNNITVENTESDEPINGITDEIDQIQTSENFNLPTVPDDDTQHDTDVTNVINVNVNNG